MDKNGLRPIALEILATDNSEVVKLAGLWRRFQNWWKGFRSPEYKEKVEKLRSENQEAVELSKEIDRQLKEMNSAIKDGDIAAYDASAREAKKLMLQMTKMVANTDAETRSFMRDAYREAKEQGILQSFKPVGNDVDWEKRYEDTALRSFKWYSDLPDKIHISPGALKGLERELRKALDNAKIENIDRFFGSRNMPALLESFKEAVLGGNLIWANHREPAPEHKGDLAHKARKGDSTITVQTDTFVLPNGGPRIALEVDLNDTGRSLRGARSQSPLSLRNTGRIWIMEGSPEPKKKEGPKEEGPAPKSQPPGVNVEPQPEMSPQEKLDQLADEENQRLQEAIDEEEMRAGEMEGSEASIITKLVKQAKVDLNASKNLSPEFWKKFVAMAERLNAKPEDLAKVIMAESAFDPKAKNEQGGRVVARGLTQFTAATLPGIGMSKAQWENMDNMSAEAQLPYIEKYFKMAGQMGGINKWEDATQLYVANFAPAYLNKPNTPFYEKGSVAYAMNKGLDRDSKGFISASDLGISVSRPLPKHIKKAIQEAGGNSSSSSIDSDEVDALTSKLLSSYGKNSLTYVIKESMMRDALPESDFLVKVASSSNVNSLECARIISNILRSTINAKSSICASEEGVELQCYALGKTKTVSGAAQAICNIIANEMKRKFGIDVSASVIPEMLSKHAEVDTEVIVRNYRTFCLKRMGGASK